MKDIMKKRIVGAIVLVILGIVLPLLLARWLHGGDAGDSESMRVYEVTSDGQARAADEPATDTQGQPASAGRDSDAVAANADDAGSAASETPPMPQAVSPAAMDEDSLASSDSESFQTPPVQGNATNDASASTDDSSTPAAVAPAAGNNGESGNSPQARSLRRTASQPRGWIVQVASFGDEGYARLLASELVGEFDAFYRATDVDGKTWYRVAVGPFDIESQARSAASKLRQEGRSTLVRRSAPE